MSDLTNRPDRPHPTRIDEAIDRAVREIMHREPPPGLRRRVLARLDAPPRVRVAPGFALAAAAALMLVAVATTLMLRDGGPAPAPRAETAATPPAAAAQAAARESAGPGPQPAALDRSARRPAPARTAQPRVAVRDTRTFGPAQGRVAATSVPDTLAGPPLPRDAATAGATELPLPAGLPPLPDIQIAPIRIDAIPVPPITIK